MSDPDRLILLGEIGAAHGIRGEVSIRSFTAEPEDVAAYGPLTDASGKRTFTIAAVRGTPKGIIARIAGVSDRTAAEKLRNIKLYVPRSRLPAPDDGTFYHEDLIGLSAAAPDGTAAGKVVAVLNYGAGDLLEIERLGEKETLLLPFTDACVPKVDLAARTVTVVLPDYTEATPDTDGESSDVPV